jgi:hypothetical protein
MTPQEFMEAMGRDGWTVSAFHGPYGNVEHALFTREGKIFSITMEEDEPIVDGLSFDEVLKIIRDAMEEIKDEEGA